MTNQNDTPTALHHAPLWTPVTLGDFTARHRLAMAPMTRSRAQADGSPTALNALYYGQRASGGLIVSEGAQPSADGQGYLFTPGIYSDEHVAGWRQVADAVHARGSSLAIQLMHAGRIGHPDNTPHGRQLVAPSAVTAPGGVVTPTGMQPMTEPRALTTAEVRETVQDFRRAAAAAVRAGADGVEIHSANGYLLHQFLSSNVNQRTDEYGGPVTNRIRVVVEVATAIAEEIGAGRTGIRISPANPFNGIVETDTRELYPALVDALAPLGLAYLHVAHGGDEELLATLRAGWPGGVVVTRGGAPMAVRVADVEQGLADVVGVGSLFISNPDLVDRVRTGAPLAAHDETTVYGGDERGYTDYPMIAA